MGIKLLEQKLFFLIFILALLPELSMGQCTDIDSNTTVSISTNDPTTFCEGQSITFTSSLTNAGSGISYQWQRNNTDIGGQTGTTFTSTSLSNNDKIRLKIICDADNSVTKLSNSITVTVNQNRTGTATISANQTNICPGETVNFSASLTNAGSSPVYDWKVNGVSQGSGSSFSSLTLSGGDQVQLFVQSSLPCTPNFSSNTITITEKPGTPAQPGAISGTDEVCPGVSETYTVSTVADATEYIWTLPSGWSGSSSTNSITVTTGSSGSGNISVAAKNSCGTSPTSTLSVNVKDGTPSQPGNITGPTEVCPGSLTTPVEYSVSNDPTTTSYNWTLPSGWSFDTNNGSTITVIPGNSGQNGNISVTAENDCGISSARSISVSVKPGTPATPGPSSGPSEVCPGTSVTYSVSPVSNATEYIWTLPSGWTGSSTTNSITVTTGTTGTADLSVAAKNDCDTGAAYTWNITVKDGTPVSSGSITQTITSGNTVICPGDEVKYSVSGPAEATQFNWTVPNGWSITAGSGTSEITVNAGNYGQDGNISVKPENSCGIGPESNLSVSVDPPAPETPGAIDGPVEVCQGTSQTYTIDPVENATEYIWSLPGGWSGSSTSNSITVTTGPSGDISVAAKNNCGTSALASLSVTGVSGAPAQPGSISGTDSNGNPVINICPVINGLTFEVAPVANADSYNWDLPSGWVITNGSDTEKITVNVPANSNYPNSVFVKVAAVNICGESSFTTYYTDVNNTEGINIGNYVEVNAGEDQTVCRTPNPVSISGNIDFNGAKLKIVPEIISGSGTFNNVPNGKVGNFTFQYIPSNNDIQNLNEVIIRVSPDATPGGSCTGDFYDEMKIIFRDAPSASISGDATICEGDASPITFTGSPNIQVTYTINGGANQNITLDASGQASLDSGVLINTTTFQLVSAIYTDDPTCSGSVTGSATITVTPTPSAAISYEDACTSSTSLAVDLTGTGDYTGGTFSADSGLSIDASSGEINPSLSTPGNYTIIYTIPASGGCEEIDVTTDVNIIQKVVITSEPSEVRACEAGGAQFEVAATGEGLTYQWFKSSATPGNEVPGGTANVLNLSNLDISDAGDYIVVVSGTAPCSSVTSASASLIIDQNITIDTQPESQSVCENGVASISVSASVGGAALGSGFTYQWFKGSPGSSSAVSGGTSATLNIDPASLADTGDYYVEITGPSDYECEPVSSSSASLIVRPTPTVTISGDAEICSGSDADISFSDGIPNGIVTYTINGDNTNPYTFNLDANGDGTLNTGALSATSNSDTDFVYAVQSVAYPDAPDCSTGVSGSVTITVAPDPVVTIAFPDNQTEFCNTSSPGLTFTPTLTGTGTYEGGTFTATGLTIDPNDGSINPGNENSGDYTITYTIPAFGGCPEEVATLDISIYEEVKITSQPFNIGICSTQDAEFSVTATGDDLTYQWYKDGSAIPGAESPVLSLPVATSEDAGEYYVMVSGTNACTPTEASQVQSDIVTLNVDEDIVIVEPAVDVVVCETGNETVSFRFVVHANGAPLDFEWIDSNGNPIAIDGTRVTSQIQSLSNYEDYTFDVYEGILTINNVTESDEGSYAVKVDGSQNNFTCPEAISNSFKLEVNPVPDAPVVENVQYCTGETAVALTANGTNLEWYDENMNPLSSAPVPVTDSPAEFTYYVTQTPVFCESDPAMIKVFVYARPDKPTVDGTTINYCLGETASALTATPETDATLNWYDSASSTTPLTEAPSPQTTAAGTLEYWVSQTNINNCEGEREKITVNINKLPLIVPPADATICEGDTVSAEVSDTNDSGNSTTFLWEDANGNSFTGSSADLSPTETTTYTITATNSAGCINTDEFTITVDPLPVGGTLDGPSSLCITNTSGSLELTGQEGNIEQWEYNNASVSAWTPIANSAGLTTFDFTDMNLQEATSFRVLLSSGVCTDVYSAEFDIQIDPVPEGGELNFATGDRVFLVCENPGAGYAAPLNLTGIIGEVVQWQYRGASATSWSTISGFTGLSLSANEIENLNISETTVFRVEIASGACTPNVFSETAIISVIPSDIKPNPVTVDPGVVCFGEEVRLSSETGYQSGSTINDDGYFDNAGITNHGWRVRRNGSTTDIGFDTDANNTRPDRWKRATPHPFTTANLTPPYSFYDTEWGSGIEDGNKGFAVVSSNNSATMETPVFGISATDPGILTFDQAYNLTPGASISVEISTDGGNTYTTLYYKTPTETDQGITSDHLADFGLGTIDTRPENKIQIDLGDYVGFNNLRIRFSYVGTRIGDVWAIDNIAIPEGPQGLTMEWTDYTDPDNPILIGTNNTETYTPTLIGWNNFEVRTKVVLDSNGNTCSNVENFETISVYVFDNYTSTATAIEDDCGDDKIQLNGVITGAYQGEVTEFPEDDESTASWELVSGPAGYTYSPSHFTNDDPSIEPINDPNAVFTPGVPGQYVVRWKITQDPDSPCEVTYDDLTFGVLDCTTLDFDGIDDYVAIEDSYSGAQSIEAWVRPESENGPGTGKVATILAGEGYELYLNAGAKPVFKWSGTPITSNKSLDLDGRWYHLAVTFGGGTAKLYIDGIEISDSKETSGSSQGSGGIFPFLIGAGYDDTTQQPDNYFSGWIEEVRIWNQPLTENQIRFMMNQRLIDNGAQMGELIPMDVPDGLVYSDLLGYYRLISSNPDPANLVAFDPALMPNNGLTPDLAQTSEPGRMHNMETNQQNTAPLPYISATDGQTWGTDNTWIRPAVWDPPHSTGVDGTPIEWNIAQVSHNIDSGSRDITVLGLLSDTPGKLLTMAAGGALNENNTGQMLRVTNYLLLDGNIDLVGESQLLQDQGSLLAEASQGWLERDQQGTKRSYNYNYWSSPVSLQGAANNADYSINQVLYDGTNSVNPGPINYQYPYAAADGALTSPITLSTYWMWRFRGTADVYEEWIWIGANGNLRTGEGYTMKGTEGSAAISDRQNYVFKGKPHNGDFTRNIGMTQNYLIGNPYPSAMDADLFILDNLNSAQVAGATNTSNIFNGAIYFWDHFAGQTHILREYVGGYATYTLAGGIPAISNDERINDNDAKGTKEPQRYIPVAQGFFVNTGLDDNLNNGINVQGGDIVFKNSQRAGIREGASSIFLMHRSQNRQTAELDTRAKIRLKFHSPLGYHRQLLATEDEITTDGFDLGYDAPLIENNAEDMYWLIDSQKLVIQAVPDFDKDQVLPLGLKVKENGWFKIQIDSLQNWPAKKQVYLRDKALDSVHNLTERFYDAIAEPGDVHNRFEIIFAPQVETEPEAPLSESVDLRYYRNTRELKVFNPDELEISEVMIYDLNGRMIQSFDDIEQAKEFILKVRQFRSAVYIVKLKSEKGVIDKKFIMK
ncbi:Ig-like domain-containing protein [Salegentibacter chungangensis]|uniref:LamG-like jellyroll fold domain-containing protein n=1 Tax=Salegentibacter chungangensis TaxID=1335724 RepID=A0ABW3NRP0_9FLAO